MEEDIGQLILKEVKDFRKEMNGRVRSLEIWRGMIMGGLKTGLKIFGMTLGLIGIIIAVVKMI